MLPVTSSLMHLWHEDPLRSLGVYLPIASLVFIVRAWWQLGWEWHGSAWGLLPAGVAIGMARLVGDGVVTYRVGEHTVGLLQPGLFYFVYASGVVLVLGGRALWRRSLFPLLLLFCVNPIPHLFNQFIDLPLQTASANAARGFAHALGLSPTGEQLQMLFAPRFGMVIVPGCNGIRGSVTMGYLMLFLGYWRRYRPLRLAVYVAAAVALGYLLNLLRLCVLVLYYWAGIHIQWLRPHGEGIDYLIGGSLFLTVSALAGWLLFRKDGPAPQPGQRRRMPWHELFLNRRLQAVAATLLLAALPEVPAAFARIRNGVETFTSPEAAMAAMPAAAGEWRRGAFSFEKEEADNKVIWVWAPFTRGSNGRVIEVGLWLSPLQHYALNSRRIHGDVPLWSGAIEAAADGSAPVRLFAFTMLDLPPDGGERQVPTLFAETTCYRTRCSDASLTGFGKQGLSIAVAPVSSRTERHLAMLFRVPETPSADAAAHGGADAETERQQAAADLRDLLAHMDLRAMAQSAGTQ